MHAIIRPIVTDDEPFLWQALYYAAHMEEEGAGSPEDAKNNPQLLKYVQGWGCPGDMGFLALDPHSQQPPGAAWLRLFTGPDKIMSDLDDATPDLAIAVLPGYSGKGLGTQLLTHILESARQINSSRPTDTSNPSISTHPLMPTNTPNAAIPAIILSVRVTNSAKRLYERLGFVVVGTATNRVGTESLLIKTYCLT